MSKVFVLDTNFTPFNPIHSAQARQLLRNKKAAIFRQFPFTIILKKSRPDSRISSLRLKIDPGAKFTGMALVNDSTGEVVFAAELKHRGFAIRDALTSRRQLRRSRRARKTRYRQPRFLNRTRLEGWLAPSLQSRVDNIKTWVKKLLNFAPIQAISQELVRFDMQLMANPDIQGQEYQQGTLAGYETREYLLEKWGRQCAYCGVKDVTFQVEHIHPRAKGGSNSITNLTLSCEKCNTKKGTKDIKDFLKKDFSKPLLITANGHGSRQSCRIDKYGFPNRHVPREKIHFGFQTGDIAKAVVTAGKKIGTYVGKVAIRSTGSFNISNKNGFIQGISHKFCKRIHAKDGYSYAV